MTEKKKSTEEVKDKTGLTKDELDDAVKQIIAGQSPDLDTLEQVLSANAQALARIAENQVPQNTQGKLAAQQEDHESPYVPVGDKIVMLTVSTIDLASIDGWPGYVDEPIPGKFTKQGLQKRIRFPLEINYEPSLERRYESAIVDREEFENMRQHSPGGTIPHASMVASMSLRSGGARE